MTDRTSDTGPAARGLDPARLKEAFVTVEAGYILVHDRTALAFWRKFADAYGPVPAPDPAPVREAAQRLIDYLDVREHHEDDTGIRRVDAASRPYVSDLRAALAARLGPSAADTHPFKDEWAAQRRMSKPYPGNSIAGQPIAPDQPCFTCGVPYADHDRPGPSGDAACPDCGRTHPWRDHSDPAIEVAAAAPSDGAGGLDVWATDLTIQEEDRLAKALRNADYVNWSAAEVAARIAGTVRAIAAARLQESGEGVQ